MLGEAFSSVSDTAEPLIFVLAQLVESLERARPRWIVDAAARSWTMAEGDDPRRYDLARLPQFGLRRLLDLSYVRLGRIDGCVSRFRNDGVPICGR